MRIPDHSIGIAKTSPQIRVCVIAIHAAGSCRYCLLVLSFAARVASNFFRDRLELAGSVESVTQHKGAIMFPVDKGSAAPSTCPSGPSATTDPIFAVIEAHWRSCCDTLAAYERQSEVEDELVAVFRVSVRKAEADPRWNAANDAAQEALHAQDDLALKLMNIRPTTVAGAAALLTYYADATTSEDLDIFPSVDVNGRPFKSSVSRDEPSRDFGYFIVTNVAAALRCICRDL